MMRHIYPNFKKRFTIGLVPKAELGAGLVDRRLVQAPPPPPPPSNFIAGRPRAALLFWFFGDFRCCALLFMVILVVCGYRDMVEVVVKC